MLADRRPALLCPLPNTCPETSLRCRLGGRADAGVAPLAVGGLDGWRPPAEEGARLADMEGDGDERERGTPFVWIPGGMGRLILVGAETGGAATTVGAILMGPAAAGGSNGKGSSDGVGLLLQPESGGDSGNGMAGGAGVCSIPRDLAPVSFGAR
jgi:hypothetical protein